MNVKYHFFRSSYSSQFFVLSGIAFVSNIAYTMTSILFAIFANNIGLDIKQIGLIISAMTLGALISGPIWGKIVDRTGKRKLVLLLCLTGQGVFCLLTPFMKNFLPLFLARFFFGFFLVAQAPILNEIIIKNRDPEMRGKKLSFINIIRGVAYSFAVILSGFMIVLLPG
ncbi:MAG: MFS transporter [Candidatus Atribacteria bacterium]|nr:MFS transporter [Candidatus Atribacteria bacterium]